MGISPSASTGVGVSVGAGVGVDVGAGVGVGVQEDETNELACLTMEAKSCINPQNTHSFEGSHGG